MDINEAQKEQWNGAESDHWVLHADRYDAQLVPFADALFEQLELSDRDAVLDIGCGCGVTTLAASRQAARAVGVDLSEPMLEVARTRMGKAGITNAEFLTADAQTYDFGSQKFTAVISRFGVMFFDDQVAAFSNLHRVLVPTGRLSFVCWQPLAANEWLLVPGLAATQYVSLPDLGDGTEPGMFALSDDERLREILSVRASPVSWSSRSSRRSLWAVAVTWKRRSPSFWGRGSRAPSWPTHRLRSSIPPSMQCASLCPSISSRGWASDSVRPPGWSPPPPDQHRRRDFGAD